MAQVAAARSAVAAPNPTASLKRDAFNSQSLGRGLNAHVKQVGNPTSIALRSNCCSRVASDFAASLRNSNLWRLSDPREPIPTVMELKSEPHFVAPLTEAKQSKVLLVGAGGIGCELLKNLVLTGFGEVHVVDLDTIDLSNLNRQFLFRQEHIKKSKALVRPVRQVVAGNC